MNKRDDNDYINNNFDFTDHVNNFRLLYLREYRLSLKSDPVAFMPKTALVRGLVTVMICL